MTAPVIPGRAYGSTTDQIVSHLVAPRASAASRWLRGTARRTSREIAVMIGRIMIARMIPDARIPMPR